MKKEMEDGRAAEQIARLRASYLTTAEYEQRDNPQIKPLIDSRRAAEVFVLNRKEQLEAATKEYNRVTDELILALLPFVPKGIFPEQYVPQQPPPSKCGCNG